MSLISSDDISAFNELDCPRILYAPRAFMTVIDFVEGGSHTLSRTAQLVDV